MLSDILVHWNVLYLISCTLVNFIALVVHLGTWRQRYHNKTKRSRFDVASPSAVITLYVISVNLLYITLCKLPLLHAQWFAHFRFSETVCHIIIVLCSSYECILTVSFSTLSIFLWHRQKKTNYYYKDNLLDEGRGHQLANGLRQGCLAALISSVVCVIVGICSSHRYLSPNPSSPLAYISSSGSFYNDSYQDDSKRFAVCKAQSPYKSDPSTSHWWEITFRWIIGFCAPLLLVTLPSIAHLYFWQLRHLKTFQNFGENSADERGDTRLLVTYLRFGAAILWIDFLTRIPSSVNDIYIWYTSDKSHEVPSINHKFVLYILTVVLPELKLFYFPLATLILLPGINNKTKRRKNPQNFSKSKCEDEDDIFDGENESFVVSHSPLSIQRNQGLTSATGETPSVVRIPERPKIFSRIFKSSKEKRNELKYVGDKKDHGLLPVAAVEEADTTTTDSNEGEMIEKKTGDWRRYSPSPRKEEMICEPRFEDFAYRLATSPTSVV